MVSVCEDECMAEVQGETAGPESACGASGRGRGGTGSGK